MPSLPTDCKEVEHGTNGPYYYWTGFFKNVHRKEAQTGAQLDPEGVKISRWRAQPCSHNLFFNVHDDTYDLNCMAVVAILTFFLNIHLLEIPVIS